MFHDSTICFCRPCTSCSLFELSSLMLETWYMTFKQFWHNAQGLHWDAAKRCKEGNISELRFPHTRLQKARIRGKVIRKYKKLFFSIISLLCMNKGWMVGVVPDGDIPPTMADLSILRPNPILRNIYLHPMHCTMLISYQLEREQIVKRKWPDVTHFSTEYI